MTIRVGKGDISARIAAHRTDEKIKYVEQTMVEHLHLRVTWAKVPESSQESVEKFLSDRLDPLLGDRFPDVDPTPVNLPPW